MKHLKGLLLAMTMMVFGLAGTVVVSASPTDLSSMTIYAVDAAGNKSEVPIQFNSTTYNYDITVKSTALSIDVQFKTEDATSTAQVVNAAYFTKLDIGLNKTQVLVTAADRTTGTYTINTTRVTADKDSQVSYEKTDEDNKEEKNEKKKDKNAVKVKVGKRTLKIQKKITAEVPKGFDQSTFEYKGKEYDCIVKGDAEHLVALYLYNSKIEGFYVYDQDNDTFYPLKNVNVASRMYTVINYNEPSPVLKNYPKQSIEMGEETVKAWVLDAEEGVYLVYAMNWDEEINLYAYDSQEGVFQRYMINEDAYSQQEAAEVAYKKLQKNRTTLANKYNRLLKVVAGLLIFIVMLIFVLINMKLDRKAKKLQKEEQLSDDALDEEEYSAKQKKKEEKKQKKAAKNNDAAEIPEEEDLREVPEDAEADVETEDFTEYSEEEDELEEMPKRGIFGRKKAAGGVYGDMPTFGSEFESTEGFYGGEIIEEDEVLIDITDDNAETEPEDSFEISEDASEEPVVQDRKVTPEEIMKSEEEDLKETLKSMLPPEEDEDDDDDDDFEFIDLD
ncbi:MAG: cadherin-like beta sandwich domain-containing protein [Eubacterium sp.]|nr:cadherin-like beta sandwich domain-containing protein [Eubacterium sp.]